MIFFTLLKQDLKVGIRQRLDLVLLLVFTAIAALLFPIAIGPEPQILARIAPGLIWVLVLFATHMATPGVWAQDVDDGTYEQLRLARFPLEWIVLSKALSVWMLSFGGLFLLIPFLGLAFGMEADAILVMIQAFIIASIPLSFLTVTGGLMTHGNGRPAILSTIIFLPLYLPLLIFSCSACDAATSGDSPWVYMMILASIALILSPGLLYVNTMLLKWLPE